MIDAALHGLCLAFLRCLPFGRAHAAALRVGALLPPLRTADEVRRLAGSLRWGTCLSRSLAIASRTPRASLVIGVERRESALLTAHAWVEIDGEPLHSTDPAGVVIARLNCPGAPPVRPRTPR